MKPLARWLAPVLLLVALIPPPGSARAASEGTPEPRNLILNGNLTNGTGGAPEFWASRAYKTGAEYTSFRWNRAAGAPGSLEILSTAANDARWEQQLRLEPGWYFFTAELRAEDVALSGTGGCLSLIDNGVYVTRELRGTTGWQKIGFYIKASPRNATADLACRLGGFGALNTGKLFCRRFALTKVSVPPADGTPRFDLDMVRAGAARSPGFNAELPRMTLLMAVACAVLLIVLAGRLRLGLALGRLQGLFESRGPDSAVVSRTWSEPGIGLFDQAGPALAAIAGVIVLAWLAIRRLDGTPYAVNPAAAIEGIKPLLLVTGIAAIKLWSFWAFSSIILAAIIFQVAPEIDLLDALLGAASGVWAIAYLMGQALGPIGLFRPLALWLLVGLGVLQIIRRPPTITRRAMRPGEKCALLAVGLLAIGMLPLQLGSPVPPYMDVLSYPASVERILAFKVYLPFDNDPFGCWGARAQTPALELFYAALALGAHVTRGVLACSAVMLPVAALVIFATYRLGLTLAGDALGGMAVLLLFFTNIFRRLPGMRGTAVDFALAALGLAFFFDRRRSPPLFGLGCILLGTSVAAHAIDGASAMLVAGLGSLLFLFDGDKGWFRVSVLGLSGAVLFAWPEVMIGLGKPAIFPVLPIIQVAGIGIIVVAVRSRRRQPGPSSESLRLAPVSVGVIPAALVIIYIYFAAKGWIGESLRHEFPILSLLALAGFLIWVTLTVPRRSAGSILVLLALSEATAYLAATQVWTNVGGDVFRAGLADIGLKLEQYWCPYFLVFPAAVPFALLFHHWHKGRPLVVFSMLTLLIYPWYERFHADYDYNEHSIAENWGIDLSTAAGGFWVTTPDSRWTLDRAGFALVDFLRSEQAKGLITTQTHVLHLTHDVTPLGEFNRFSVFTGINDDPIVYYIPFTDLFYGYLAGGRVRRVSEWSQAVAEQPPYILEQVSPPKGVPDPPSGYDEVFHQGALKLFRRRSG